MPKDSATSYEHHEWEDALFSYKRTRRVLVLIRDFSAYAWSKQIKFWEERKARLEVKYPQLRDLE